MPDFSAGDASLRISLDGMSLVERRLQGMMRRCDNWRPVLEDVGDLLLEHLDSAFDTGGAATKHGWRPLSPAYERWKSRHYPGKPVLTRTGALARSLTKSGPGSLYALTNTQVAVGSQHRAGAYGLGRLHQYGTSRMPRRRIFDLPDHTVSRILQTLRQHVSWENVD